MNILDTFEDPKLFRPWFKDRATYEAWFAFTAAMFAIDMTPEQLAIYRKHTGRIAPPSQAATEAALIIGRRGGKSLFLALWSVYLACFRKYDAYLQPGERATIMILAADRRQARVIFRYISGMLNDIPLLKRMVERETAESFDLSNRTTIEVGTASSKSTRGYAFAAVCADEIAFWPTNEDAAEVDESILAAIRPGMASIPGSLLLLASSPYARKGALFRTYDRWYGKEGGPLVWQAATREMNPTIPQLVIDQAMERDASSASAEFMARFRTDIETLFTRESVLACVDSGVAERPYIPGVQHWGFADPSGGSADSYTAAVASRNGDQIIINAVREIKPPFSPDAATKELSDFFKSYGIRTITGDRYAGEYPRELFRKNGIEYMTSSAVRSELYLSALLPLTNAKRLTLLDNERVINQMIGLERRTGRGRDVVDHAPGQHDDVANAVAGAAWLANRRASNIGLMLAAPQFIPLVDYHNPATDW
ncbi:hypothetical protein [Rhizobium leguminosarum]|uniref:hypothetical protein n=1 Tax=Rhizobium leguminosarum TaxID=384 RepID=UPI000424E271|nr:hypothetical protein [Rhizobium leguminosarum]